MNNGSVTTSVVDLEVLARVGKALSHPVRQQILLRLLDAPAYPADLSEALVLPPPALSNHLACLRGCGLVVATPEGRRLRYELAHPALAHALSDLAGLVLAVEEPACGPEEHR